MGSPTSRQNIESSYGSMTLRERHVMHVEVLRVLASILANIAQAMTNTLAAEGSAGAEGEGDDGPWVNV